MAVLFGFLFLLLCCQSAEAQGIPYFRNYAATEYSAHNQNFDIAVSDDGTVFAANFEGLLYYDNARWRIIHTPGITRITVLYRDSRGRLWTGGYNFIGRLETDGHGILGLTGIGSSQAVSGEVTRIWEADSTMYMQVGDDACYMLTDSTITPTSCHAPPTPYRSPLSSAHVTQTVDLDGGMCAMATNGEGVIVVDREGNELGRINEDDGLCSNNVNRLAYNGHGLLWGVTDNGIFTVAIPSVYSRFTPTEGLRGEVLSIAFLGDRPYVGTSGGLYCLRGNRFVPVEEIGFACWQLQQHGNHLLAATADGVYAIDSSQQVSVLTTANTLSLLIDGDDFYTGEMDGVYLNRKGGDRRKVWDVEKIVRMVRDDAGTLWLQNLYGRIWRVTSSGLSPLSANDAEEIHTLVSYEGRVTPVAADDNRPFPYPLFSYADDQGLLWLTDNKGKQLSALKGTQKDEAMSRIVYPLMDFSVQAMTRRGDQLWMGGDKGLAIVDESRNDPVSVVIPQLRVRSVMLFGDSIVWGGYGEQIETLPPLQDNENHIVFSYAIDFPSLMLPTQYRTRLNGGTWSAWETSTFEEYSNLTYGSFRFEVQARDAYGRTTDIVGVNFRITPPFYLRWYMIVMYVLLLAAVVYALVKFRLHRLEKDKHRLEAVVQERTADLVRAQHELVRQEKMATVGKLTQGLIDRILNPLNYINNFAKLSENLIGDAIENIRDEKDNITPDTYDDTMDILDMLRGNLQKVGEHGANTSRVLKAMEELLKDRMGGQADISLTELLAQNEQKLHKMFEKEMAEHHISAPFTLPAQEVRMKGNPELLGMAIMNLLQNAVYAVMKKVQQGAADGYRPEVRLQMDTTGGKTVITVRDNGTGIEETIIHRIFDPFFTTKTTGEASGVGLYICHEVVQNHGGDITVRSEKGSYTEFTVTLPQKKE